MRLRKGDVWRITVDEKLGTEMARLLVSKMRNTTDIGFLVDEDLWGDERHFVVAREPVSQVDKKNDRCHYCWDKVRRDWRIPAEQAPEWEQMAEGMVFLSGYFDLEPYENTLLVKRQPERKRFIRMDLSSQVNEDLKWLYYHLLQGEVQR